MLEPLTDEFGGDGGGHASAGVAKLDSAETEAIEARIVKSVETAPGMQFGPLR